MSLNAGINFRAGGEVQATIELEGDLVELYPKAIKANLTVVCLRMRKDEALFIKEVVTSYFEKEFADSCDMSSVEVVDLHPESPIDTNPETSRFNFVYDVDFDSFDELGRFKITSHCLD